MCIPFPEPWEFEKDLRSLFTSRDFRHRRAMILKVERNIKTRENRGKELYNVRMQNSLVHTTQFVAASFAATCCLVCTDL